jgi:hypothetical protein
MIEWTPMDHYYGKIDPYESRQVLAYGYSDRGAGPYVYVCTIRNDPDTPNGPDRYRYFDCDFEMRRPTHYAYINEPWSDEND